MAEETEVLAMDAAGDPVHTRTTEIVEDTDTDNYVVKTSSKRRTGFSIDGDPIYDESESTRPLTWTDIC